MSKLKSILRDAAAIAVIVAVTTIEVYALCQIPKVSVEESSEQDFLAVVNTHNVKEISRMIEVDKSLGNAPESTPEPEIELTPEPTPAPRYVITAEERKMVAALVKLEAGNQSWECQAAVASVIFNRWDNHYAGARTLHDVVYQKNQFSPARKISRTTPTQVQYDVIDYICQNGPTLPSKVMFFHYKRYHSFGTPYCHIGTEYFSY